MICFPNAKINIGLNITDKRADGFHNIESCFYPIPWHDVLEIIPAKEMNFTSYGIKIPGDASTNLCLKAYELVKSDFKIPPVNIYLQKIIPIGAGMGGGSSDAAFTLKTLNTLFDLKLSNIQLIEYAKQLGSDCAFFIENKPVIALEKGEVFQNTSLSLTGKTIVAIYPNLHISTKEAYSNVTPFKREVDLSTLLKKPITNWNTTIINDFEKGIIKNYPTIQHIKEELDKQGAIYSSMTGSGSTVFGVFEKEPETSLNLKISFILKKMTIN